MNKRNSTAPPRWKPPRAARPRAVENHSLAQATAALRAAREHGVPVELWSAEGAAAYVGAGWFKAVVEMARLECSSATFTPVLDCADLPGLALGAFRIGLQAICFTGPPKVAAKLADIARQEGRAVFRRRPARVLDLRSSVAPLAACRAWLAVRR